VLVRQHQLVGGPAALGSDDRLEVRGKSTHSNLTIADWGSSGCYAQGEKAAVGRGRLRGSPRPDSAAWRLAAVGRAWFGSQCGSLGRGGPGRGSVCWWFRPVANMNRHPPHRPRRSLTASSRPPRRLPSRKPVPPRPILDLHSRRHRLPPPRRLVPRSRRTHCGSRPQQSPAGRSRLPRRLNTRCGDRRQR